MTVVEDVRISRLVFWCGKFADDFNIEQRLNMLEAPWGVAQRNPKTTVIQRTIDSFRHGKHGIVRTACNGVGGALVDDEPILFPQLEPCGVCNHVFCPYVAKTIALQLLPPLQSKGLVVDVRDVEEIALAKMSVKIARPRTQM